MVIHVLPGDATVAAFRQTGIEGEIAVCREALIDGPLMADSLEEFWDLRSAFLANADSDSEVSYRRDVAPEFQKLIDLPGGSEVNLWFENELFCQANMWFCLSLLGQTNASVYRVAPVTLGDDERWEGFGQMTPQDLAECFAGRTKFSAADLKLGIDLWNAFRSDDHPGLRRLSGESSACFPYLKEVCEAAIARTTRPREILWEIVNEDEKDFDGIFRAFKDRAGIYGFGDAQVERLLDEIRVT